MSDDGHQVEGHQALEALGEIEVVAQTQKGVPRLRRSAQSQGRQGKNRPRIPHRRTKNRHEGPQGPRKGPERVTFMSSCLTSFKYTPYK